MPTSLQNELQPEAPCQRHPLPAFESYSEAHKERQQVRMLDLPEALFTFKRFEASHFNQT